MQETWVQSLGWEDPRRREWQPTLVFLPGESHGQRSLVGYSPWGHKELDMTKGLTLTYFPLPITQVFVIMSYFTSTINTSKTYVIAHNLDIYVYL